MKNLLFILALLPGLAFATINTVTGGRWSAASILATDTVIFDGSVGPDTIDGDFTFVKLIRPASNDKARVNVATSKVVLTGTPSCYVDSGSGAKAMPDSLWTASNMMVAASFGSFPGSNCVRIQTGNCVDTILRLIVFKQVIVNNGLTANFSNWGNLAYVQNNSELFVFGDNCVVTLTGSSINRITAADTFFRQGTGCTFSNFVRFALSLGENNTAVMPKLIASDLSVDFMANALSRGTSGIILADTLSVKKVVAINSGVGVGAMWFNTNGKTIVTKRLNIGGFGSTAELRVKATFTGSTIYADTLSNASTSIAPATDSIVMDDGIFYTSTILWSDVDLTVLPGTSHIIALKAGTFTTLEKPLYDITIETPELGFTALADSLTCNDLTLTDGPFNAAGYGISAVDLIYTSQDSTRFQSLWLSGDFTRGALADKCDTAGQHIRFSAGASHTMAAAGKTYARVTTSGPLTITGGATIATLSYGVDGIPVTIATGTTLTAGTVSIGGTTEAPDTIQGAGAGATYTGPQDTLYHTRVALLTCTNPLYLDSSANTSGNNTNVKSLSYTGATLSSASGLPGDTIGISTGNGLVGGAASIGDSAVTLTVVNSDSGYIVVPLAMPAGSYDVGLSNSDGDTLTLAGGLSVTSSGSSRRSGRGWLGLGVWIRP